MTAEKRRSRGLLAAIVDDPLRKLIAIGLAVLLWFFIDSRITSEHVRTLPLVTVGAQSLVGEGQDRSCCRPTRWSARGSSTASGASTGSKS
jgi:hypothetical protein